MVHYKDTWNQIWGKHHQDIQTNRAWMAVTKAMALTQDSQQPRDPITPEMVMRASKMLKKGTSIGVDWCEVEWLRSMTYEVAVQVAKLLNSIEMEAAWLAQTLTNIIVLMGKPAGGVRPIALMPMLYRLWTKVRRDESRLWDTAHTGPWDTAIRGSSAFRAAVMGAMFD